MAKGLDCGTSFYITATEDRIKKQRNAILNRRWGGDSSQKNVEKTRHSIC